MGILKYFVFLLGIHLSKTKNIQFEWSSEDKGNRIKIEDPARLSYVGLAELHNLIRTTKPIPQKNWTSFYFEAKIVKGGSNNFIAIGLTEADPNTRTNCMPGWDTDNTRKHKYSTLGIGYHGDDGGIYHLNGGAAIDYFESFTTGDVIGCLVHHINVDGTQREGTTVEFTKNGKKGPISPFHIKDAVWYPTIGIASIGAVVETNFGEIDVPQCTNSDNGALDDVDDSCVGWYNENPEDCGDYDDDDFKANEMCCACKISGIHIP